MSQAEIKSADFSINEIIKQSNYRSYASRNDMSVMLKKCVRDLHQLDFKISYVKGFKAKHVYQLVEHWKEQKNIDFKVRHILTRELGHSRLSVLKSYCG